MTKHITETEILSAVPVPPIMTRKDKLERWADLISKYGDDIQLVHRLEYWDEWQLDASLNQLYVLKTAFQIASDDPMFKTMGLIDTASSAMNFFEIDQHEIHEFTCDCGGHLSNTAMARRIRNIADPTWSGWFKNLFR